jgi:pimeloyl-ACP methyl ester carboxylesterase
MTASLPIPRCPVQIDHKRLGADSAKTVPAPGSSADRGQEQDQRDFPFLHRWKKTRHQLRTLQDLTSRNYRPQVRRASTVTVSPARGVKELHGKILSAQSPLTLTFACSNSGRALKKRAARHDFIARQQKGFDFREDLKRVKCPTLVMAGEDDPINPIADSEDIAAALPHELVRFERFVGCGHGIVNDAPERFLKVVRHFLNRPKEGQCCRAPGEAGVR